MNIIIYRRRFTPWSVDGTMIINGGTFCRTIEHPKNYLPADSHKIVLVPVKIENGTEEFKTLPVIFGADDPREIATVVAERTRSEVVKVIGKKIILFRQAKKNSKFDLPK